MRGATLVEFALVAPVVVLLIMATLELTILFWVTLTMQHAVREGVRFAVTGQGGLQREQLVAARIAAQAMGLYQRVRPVLRVNQASVSGEPAQYPAGLFGAGGDMLVLQVDGSWPVATPLLRPWLGDVYRFSVAATMRNEAFE